MCSFPHFSLTCFEILICNFAYDFVLMYYRSSSSVITLHTSGSPCVHTFSGLASYMHWQLSWNLKFDFGFFNAFLLEKYYIKYPFKMFMTGVILVLRYILYHLIKGMCPKICGDIWLCSTVFFNRRQKRWRKLNRNVTSWLHFYQMAHTYQYWYQ